MEHLEGKLVLYYPIDRWKPLIIQWITTQITEIKYRMPLERYFRNVSKRLSFPSRDPPSIVSVYFIVCKSVHRARSLPNISRWWRPANDAWDAQITRPHQLPNGPISIPETARPPICPFRASDFVIPVGIALIKSRRPLRPVLWK